MHAPAVSVNQEVSLHLYPTWSTQSNLSLAWASPVNLLHQASPYLHPSQMQDPTSEAEYACTVPSHPVAADATQSHSASGPNVFDPRPTWVAPAHSPWNQRLQVSQAIHSSSRCSSSPKAPPHRVHASSALPLQANASACARADCLGQPSSRRSWSMSAAPHQPQHAIRACKNGNLLHDQATFGEYD